MAKFVKVILFLLLTVAFHSIAGNVSTEKMVDKQANVVQCWHNVRYNSDSAVRPILAF